MRLIRTPNMDDPDGLYADLLAAHRGLDSSASAALNARLILILANHVGARAIMAEALEMARTAPLPGAPAPRG